MGGGRLRRSVSWPPKGLASSAGLGLEARAPEALRPTRRRAPHQPKAALTSSSASTTSTQPVSLPAGPPSSYESSEGRAEAAELPAPKRQATGTLAWLSGGLGGGSWLKTMVPGGGGNRPAPHIAPAAAEMGLAAGGRQGRLLAYEMAHLGVAPGVADVEEGATVESFLGHGLPQDLVTEANPNPSPNPNPHPHP